MSKTEWLKEIQANEFNLSRIAYMFNACTVQEWIAARDSVMEMGAILQKAWDNAPDKGWIHDLPGWHLLCDLCSDWMFGELTDETSLTE